MSQSCPGASNWFLFFPDTDAGEGFIYLKDCLTDFTAVAAAGSLKKDSKCLNR